MRAGVNLNFLISPKSHTVTYIAKLPQKQRVIYI